MAEKKRRYLAEEMRLVTKDRTVAQIRKRVDDRIARALKQA